MQFSMRLTVFGWSLGLVGWVRVWIDCEWVRVEVSRNGHSIDDGMSIEEATMD